MILDSYAVLAFLRDEPAAGDVEALLVADSDVSLTVLGLSEVLDRLIRLGPMDEEQAVLDLAQLGLGEPPPLGPRVAMDAGLLRARYSHRTRCTISLADCVAAESAREAGAPLATSDPDLLDVCHAEKIQVAVLPDSSGVVWAPES
jgi:PIN domain nuclease of toxin-antitoxin system